MNWILILFLMSSLSFAAEEPLSLSELCFSSLKNLPGKTKSEALKVACERAAQLQACISENGEKIFHFEQSARAEEKAPKRILVFSLMHGDETPSGSVARSWIERLPVINPRNTWRVIPILNPDGLKAKTRYNARG